MRAVGAWLSTAAVEAVLWALGPVVPWSAGVAGPPALVAFDLVRLGLMVIAAYWFVLLTAARLARLWGWRMVLALPGGRRAVVLGAALTSVSVAGSSPAAYADSGPGPVPVLVVGQTPPSVAARPKPSPAHRTVTKRPARRASLRRASAVWRVKPGDNLWTIAEQTVYAHLGRRPSEQEIGRYWLAVVALNRARLPEPADADLLFPGDAVVLPDPGTLLPWAAES